MSILKSSAEDLTLNADGSGNDIKFQSNGVEVGSLTAEGVLTVTSSEPKIHLVDTDASASGYAKIRGGASGAVFLEADPTDAEDNSHITFKVDNTQMGRFTTDGLCFNSDSAAANALDDYEEGTWTPSVGGNASYTTQSATYTKVGRLVTVRAEMTINVIGTGSTTTMSGLPFVALSGSPTPFSAGYYANLATTITWLGGYVNGGFATLQFVSNSTATSTLTNAPTLFGNSARVDICATYMTA